MRFNRLTLVFCAASLIAVGCGDDDGGGGGADAGDSVDANDIDAAPPTATCGVSLNYTSSAPRAGQLVAFNRPDGSLIGTAITDVDGQAFREDCVADTMLTLYQDGFLRGLEALPGGSLFTVAGVQPGDTVQVGVPSSGIGGPVGPTTINASVNQDISAISGQTPVAYDFLSGRSCPASNVGAPTPPPNVALGPIAPWCQDDAGQTRVLALARDGSNAIIGFAVGAAPFVAGTEIAIALGAWTAAPGADIEVTLNNFPVTATSWNFELREKIVGQALGTYGNGGPVVDPSVNFSRSQGLPLASVDTHEARVRLLHGNFGGPGIRGPGGPSSDYVSTTIAVGVAPVASHTLDLGALMLPRIAGAFVTAPDVASEPLVQWFADGDLSVADGVIFTVSYTSSNGNSFRREWSIVTPDASGMFQTPTLPDSLLEFAPSDGDLFTVERAIVSDMDWLDYQTLINTEIEAILQAGLLFDQPPFGRLLLPPPGVPYTRRTSVFGDDFFGGGIIVEPPIVEL